MNAGDEVPRILAVAFDLDGLMVNTEDIYDLVMDEILRRRGQKFDLPLKLEMMGLTANDAFAVLKRRCNIQESYEELGAEVHSLYLEMVQEKVRPMEGLLELFGLIDERSIPRAVTTSSPRMLAQVTLETAGIKEGFQFVLTGDDVKRGKPEPEIYESAASRFSVPAAQMLVLEDSLTGSLAASRAGAFTVAVPGRHSLDQDFEHVKFVADGLTDPRITDLLEG